jgi:hypothetical protein
LLVAKAGSTAIPSNPSFFAVHTRGPRLIAGWSGRPAAMTTSSPSLEITSIRPSGVHAMPVGCATVPTDESVNPAGAWRVLDDVAVTVMDADLPVDESST